MDLKGMLRVSTGLIVVCASFMSSFAQAEDSVTQSQINAANGVAGLNASKQVTADINNSKVATEALQLNKNNDRLRFVTNSSDTNNSEIDLFYNRDSGNKDLLGNVLDANTFYFTNNKYGNNYRFNGNVTASNVIVNTKLTLNGQSVNDAVTKANNALLKSQVNVANGIAGLNESEEVTANISSKQVYTPFMMLPNTGTLRFNTDSGDASNTDLNIFYNRDHKVDEWQNKLDANTLYFTNNHHGNNYKFVGNVSATGNLTVKNLHIQLSTPFSSYAPCSPGDIKDDTNYHYVCVDTNKWKRVALSDF